MQQDIKQRWEQYVPVLKTFYIQFKEQMVEDRIAITAGHLAYVTLLSLVPFIMVFVAILQAFPAFQNAKEKLETFVFNNFVPAAGDAVQQYVGEFVGNASQMGAISILFLVVVALLLISNIDKTLNLIWGTRKQRPIVLTFAIYWTVITLGPMLVGTSLAMTSYLVTLTTFADEYTPGITTLLLKTTPFIISFGVYFILYMVVPNKSVKAGHAALGAIFATILFELGKRAFALYVTSFPSYELIYGALAAVPILFVWVYLCWMIVLLGAVFTVQIEIMTSNRRNDKKAESSPA